MTVKDFVNTLFENGGNWNSQIIIQKELNHNIWVNADLEIAKIEDNIIVCDFNFPTDNFIIERKN